MARKPRAPGPTAAAVRSAPACSSDAVRRELDHAAEAGVLALQGVRNPLPIFLFLFFLLIVCFCNFLRICLSSQTLCITSAPRSNQFPEIGGTKYHTTDPQTPVLFRVGFISRSNRYRYSSFIERGEAQVARHDRSLEKTTQTLTTPRGGYLRCLFTVYLRRKWEQWPPEGSFFHSLKR